MEKPLLLKSHRGFRLRLARVNGKYLGAIEDGRDQLFKCNGKSFADTEAILVSYIDSQPELLLRHSPIVLTYRSLDIRCARLSDSTIAIAELRGVTLFREATNQDELQTIEKLKQQIDRGQDVVKFAIADNHKSLLEQFGVLDFKHQTRFRKSARFYRTAHCWNCARSIDNQTDYECNQCGWIVCPCGACDCTRQVYLQMR